MTDKHYCGGWTSIAHGENAICGQMYGFALYQCSSCRAADALTEVNRLRELNRISTEEIQALREENARLRAELHRAFSVPNPSLYTKD